MNTSAEEIVFDENGVCNFCHQAQKALKENEQLSDIGILDDIIRLRKKNKYDCLIGLSGGLDSSFALHLLVNMGLRPLAFSVDNGWNDPKADENIMRLVEGMRVPFYRYTIDLKKFRKLQEAFLQSGTENAEIPTDHVLLATTYEMADKYGIKYIFSGGNSATESIMPPSWGYNARDLVHIKDIYKRFTGEKLTGLPTCSLLKYNYYKWVKGIRVINLLDFTNYNRVDAFKLLEKKYGYKSYGEKHCESRWTQWFQNFYLFEKFGIDKRKAHLSSEINSGQMTREEAIKIIETNPWYPELGIEKRVLKYPKHKYTDYKTDEKRYLLLSKVIKKLR